MEKLSSIDIDKFRPKKELVFSHLTYENKYILSMLFDKQHIKLCKYIKNNKISLLSRFNLSVMPVYIQDIILNINNIDLKNSSSCEYTDYIKKINRENIDKTTVSLLFLSLLVGNFELFKIILNSLDEDNKIYELNNGVHKNKAYSSFLVSRPENNNSSNAYVRVVYFDFFKIALLYDNVDILQLLEKVKGYKFLSRSYVQFIQMNLLKKHNIYPSLCFSYFFDNLFISKDNENDIQKIVIFSLKYKKFSPLNKIFDQLKTQEWDVKSFNYKLSKKAFAKSSDIFISLFLWQKENNKNYTDQMLKLSFESIKSKNSHTKFLKIYNHIEIYKYAQAFFKKEKLNVDLMPWRLELVSVNSWNFDEKKLIQRLNYIHASLNTKEETVNRVYSFFKIFIDKWPSSFINMVDNHGLLVKFKSAAIEYRSVELVKWLEYMYLNLSKDLKMEKVNGGRSIL